MHPVRRALAPTPAMAATAFASLLAAAALPAAAQAQERAQDQTQAPERVQPAADGIAQPLTDTPGDPARGRAIVASRQAGLCLLCHAGPLPEERSQGDLAPSLAGAGARYSAAQLRLRLVDPKRLNPETIMPSYARHDGFLRPGTAWRGRPILEPQQIEDVVAFLQTLR